MPIKYFVVGLVNIIMTNFTYFEKYQEGKTGKKRQTLKKRNDVTEVKFQEIKWKNSKIKFFKKLKTDINSKMLYKISQEILNI